MKSKLTLEMIKKVDKVLIELIKIIKTYLKFTSESFNKATDYNI